VQSTWMPKIAGILNIIAGAIGIFGCILIAIFFNFVNNNQNNPELFEFGLGNSWVLTLFTAFIIINVLAIAGGILAVKKKLWAMALTGSICALLSLWAGVLGIASIIFLILSRNEIRNNANGQ
jgi:hypothetical protein